MCENIVRRQSSIEARKGTRDREYERGRVSERVRESRAGKELSASTKTAAFFILLKSLINADVAHELKCSYLYNPCMCTSEGEIDRE